jgi:hypothetical protein
MAKDCSRVSYNQRLSYPLQHSAVGLVMIYSQCFVSKSMSEVVNYPAPKAKYSLFFLPEAHHEFHRHTMLHHEGKGPCQRG